MEIAVVGRSEFVTGFRLTGVRKVYEVETDEDLVECVHRVLEDENVGILVLNQDDVEKFSPMLKRRLDESIQPTVLTIGGKEEAVSLREKIRRAVGVDLWRK
ncbi:MAG: V-type ATP synthase subunit F [Methanocellales archaeon]